MDWPKPTSAFVKSALSAHSNFALVFSALIYLICFTGTLLMIERSIESWEQPRTPTAMSVNDAAVISFAKGLEDTLGSARDLYIAIPAEERQHLWGTASDPDGASITMSGDPETGEVLGERRRAFSDMVEQLHIRLHVPQSLSHYGGRYLVGALGLVLLAIIFSGLLSHPRIFRDAFHLRRGGTARSQEVDFHNRLSVWALPFHLIVTVTGAALGLMSIFVAVLGFAFFDSSFKRATDAVEPPYGMVSTPSEHIAGLADVVSSNRDLFPDDLIRGVGIEGAGTAQQLFFVYVRVPGQLAYEEVRKFDASGDYLGTAGYAEGYPGLQTLSALVHLHFGQFGGLALNLAYFVLGFALCAVICSGVRIWFVRMQDRGRQYPMWEKAWAACVWGLPAAFVVSAMLSVHLSTPPLAGALVALAATFVLAMAMGSPSDARHQMRRLLAVLCLVAALVHFVRFGFQIDVFAYLVQAVLTGTAVGLAIFELNPAFRRTPRPDAGALENKAAE